MMDMKEEMMGDSIDDVMEDDLETEEEEGNKILEEVLAEIGVSVGQQASVLFPSLVDRCTDYLTKLGEAPSSTPAAAVAEPKQRTAVAMGGDGGASSSGGQGIDDLQSRLDALRKD